MIFFVALHGAFTPARFGFIAAKYAIFRAVGAFNDMSAFVFTFLPLFQTTKYV
jgi:hypothetical protein